MASQVLGPCLFRSGYNDLFLHYLSKKTGELQNFLRFDGEEIGTADSKFEVEQASSGGELVHIRCCYNNKYWVRQAAGKNWIVAAADEPEENQSKWSCTLFKPIYVGEADGYYKQVRFLHVQNKNYACLWRANEPIWACLTASWSSPNQDLCDVFTVMELDSLAVLPKYVAFKGDNDRYLASFSLASGMSFRETDIGEDSARFEVIAYRNGRIRVKKISSSSYWERESNDVIRHALTEPTGENSLFWPLKVDEDEGIIAFRNAGNKKFCQRGNNDAFYANLHTIPNTARLQVEEVVLLRRINKVNYRMDDARIYNEHVRTMGFRTATNWGAEPYEHEFSVSYTDIRTSTWTASLGVKVGMSIEFSTGIPLIFTLDVKLSGEIQGSYEWGKTMETTTNMTSKYKYRVPPRTKVTVFLLATQATCDIPFSYNQQDTYTDGRQTLRKLRDGVFTGVNYYNFTYQVEEEHILRAKEEDPIILFEG